MNPSIHHQAPRDRSTPNLIPVSPSVSALNALSLFEPAPSVADSETASVRTVTPGAPSEPTPTSEGLPEIPDYNSKSSEQIPVPIPPPKQSKLSLLASSRASSASTRSESSRASGIALTGSVKTFPALRPSANSARPPNSAAPSRISSSRPSSSQMGENEEYFRPPSTTTSSMTSHVRRAIQTAMDLEAVDEADTPKVASKVPPTIPSSRSSSRAETPTQPQSHPQSPALLRSSPSPAPSNVPTHAYREVDTFRPPSKLALLAQAKTNANRGPKVQKPVTEYLIPTANGPTATTAITTSYQTLYTLTDPTRSQVIPAQHVVPLGTAPPHQEVKRSKLAAKIRKAHEKQYTPSSVEEEVITPPVSPMFYPKSSVHVRASPSAFASLLVEESLISLEDKDKDRTSRRRDKEHRQKVEAALSGSDASPERRKHRSRKHRHEGPSVPDFSPPLGFKFDNPSPDDIVLHARRGTALAQQKGSSSPVSPRKTTSTVSSK
ncbi:hypothetical protein FPV67DRAFT_396515 [Lyophyllum atratum]|nr:hypothetical protein FPV67DRAFT_396515 [Lyophyllum atratum]